MKSVIPVRNKDFIETAEGLVFAVLVDNTEADRHLCFLRYLRADSGYRKVTTGEAKQLIHEDFAQYRFYSRQRDVEVHGVRDKQIVRHYRPMQRLREILESARPDAIEDKLIRVATLLEENGLPLHRIGVTGSLLIGAQSTRSDIDLVVYGREEFDQLRHIVQHAILEKVLEPLNDAEWREAYRRRACSLSFDEYCWHEQRKFNKACLSGTKIDFSFVPEFAEEPEPAHRKIESTEIIAQVTDARRAFDTPARYQVAHPEILEILSFTPTFAGQAIAGETIVARGMLEESERGTRRLVIGSSREAPGEFLKVSKTPT